MSNHLIAILKAGLAVLQHVFDRQQFYERTNSHSIIQAILRVFIIARVKKEAMDIWVWVPKFPFDFPILENIHKLSLALLVRCSYWFAE